MLNFRWPSRWMAAHLAMTIAVLAAALSFLAPLSPVAAQDSAAAAMQVQVVDFAFEPGSLTVAVGTTVTWTNAGARPHTVTADDGTFDSGRLDPGEQFSHTFDRPGTYAYHCGFHPEMQGQIVVAAQQPDAVDVATPSAAEGPSAGSDTATAPVSGAAGPVRLLAPVAESRLAHVHAGTCDELGIVVYSFPNIRSYRVDESDGGGVGVIELTTGIADVPLTGLFGEPFSIHVHESAQNKQTYIACSDVGTQPAAPWSESEGLVLQAREQNGSGYSGFMTLRPAASGGTEVTIALAASPASVETAAAQEAPPPSTTYTSPTFGYTIGYGPTWQESESVSNNGRDRFVLFNGTSYITFTGDSAYGGDPRACVDAFVAQLTADPNVSDLALATDETGAPAQGGTQATGAFAIYDHDYTFSDRVEPYTLYVACVPLIPNQAVLAIVQNVPRADFNEQVELREALLRGLTLAQ